MILLPERPSLVRNDLRFPDAEGLVAVGKERLLALLILGGAMGIACRADRGHLSLVRFQPSGDHHLMGAHVRLRTAFLAVAVQHACDLHHRKVPPLISWACHEPGQRLVGCTPTDADNANLGVLASCLGWFLRESLW